MTSTSIVRAINSKKFLFIATVIFFLPFIVFTFWNVPAADDYMVIDKREKYNFWELQNWVYHTWTGRYFATFVSTAFSYSGFLYSNYYLHTILLFLFTFFSWLFCLTQVNRYFLSNHLKFTSLILVSLLMLVLQLNIIPEQVTAFYWFSSAITYQLPLILIILLIGIIIKMLLDPVQRKIYFILAAIVIVLLNGCNEVITLFALITSTCLAGYYFFVHKKIPSVLFILYVVNIISAGFLLFAPGIIYRGSLINKSPIILIISIAVAKFIVLHWFFLKEPLWWFSLFFVSLFLSRNQHFSQQLFKKLKNVSFFWIVMFYISTGLLIYIPILHVANGSFPPRAENIICYLYSVILLLILAVCISKNTKLMAVSDSILYKYRYLLFGILIFSGSNMKKVTDTLLSGHFYKKVMQERLSLFEEAKRRQEHEVTFDAYELKVNHEIKANYPFLDRQLLKDIILKPPPIICFENDLYDINYMKEFYGIRKLNIRKN